MREGYVVGKEYVAGFLINREDQTVAMVMKKRPTWQAGKLNAIGGKIEDGETPYSAMVREFQEETGARRVGWTPFGTLQGKNGCDIFCVHFFRAFTTIPIRNIVSTQTDEEILVLNIADVNADNSIPNIAWLLRMALDIDRDMAAHFSITERYA